MHDICSEDVNAVLKFRGPVDLVLLEVGLYKAKKMIRKIESTLGIHTPIVAINAIKNWNKATKMDDTLNYQQFTQHDMKILLCKYMKKVRLIFS